MPSTVDRPPEGLEQEARRAEGPTGTLETVAPAKPLAPWLGGKRFLGKRIAGRIEAIPHRCYAEPFVGMGTVFFRRGKRPSAEVINDINGDIVNLFRVVREHPAELDRQFEWALASRQEFRRLLAVLPEALTDVQRAARFAYLQRLAFAGRPGSTSTNFSPYYPAKFRARQMLPLIRAAHRRLQRVQIECLPWDEFIRRYDRPFTLFYLDPPYWGHEADYGKGLFAREDFARMAALLAGLKGRFILSMNDRPEVRETFAGFAIEEVTTRYSASWKAAKRTVGELLIGNG